MSANRKQFEEQFALESLKSDRLRVSILIGAIVSSVSLLLLLMPFFFNQFQAAFHGNFKGFLFAVIALFGANVGYLTFEYIVLGRLIRKQLRPFPHKTATSFANGW